MGWTNSFMAALQKKMLRGELNGIAPEIQGVYNCHTKVLQQQNQIINQCKLTAKAKGCCYPVPKRKPVSLNPTQLSN